MADKRVRMSVSPDLTSLIGRLRNLKSQLTPEQYVDVIAGATDTVNRLARAYTNQTQTSYTPTIEDTVGEAYWFFDSDEQPEKIRDSLEDLKIYASSPPQLELTLIENVTGLPDDGNLRDCAVEYERGSRGKPVRAIKAKLNSATNREVGSNLASITGILTDETGSDNFRLFDVNSDNDNTYVKIGSKYFELNDVANLPGD